jgi:hypothetical protein
MTNASLNGATVFPMEHFKRELPTCGRTRRWPKSGSWRGGRLRASPCQGRLGKMPVTAIHWITGAPGVNVKIGFPVGNAKFVFPSPP